MAGNGTSRYDDFDALATRHRGLIRSLCWWHAGGDAERVADLMQEVLAHLWHYRHTLRSGATPAQERAWVRVRCRSVFEHLRRRPQVETVPLEAAQQVAADDTSARDTIDRLAADLTVVEHRVLDLVLDGYTDGEIGEVLHIAPAEASRLHTAIIEKMRQKANNG
ncbi:MAG: sigma-70 family RNA polymerase sigma factor [Bacteroidales bacterium]|nr:sigma-70 family RNA polymerase sigma factor [Bacteroidales bacterium]